METKTGKGKEIRIPGPDHPITILSAEGKVRVTVAGRIVAESTQALRLEEKARFRIRLHPQTSVRFMGVASTERLMDEVRFEEGGIVVYMRKGVQAATRNLCK